MPNKNTPDIRFGEFTQDWEECKIGEITESYSGGTPSAGNKLFYGGNIPFIRSGEINSESTELFITEDGLKNSSAKIVEEGDILYALYGATSGEVGISKINGAINQAILAMKPKFEHDSYIITQWFKKQKNTIINTYLQGGQGNLSGSIVKDLMIPIPNNKDEQKSIGEFFKQLDKTISLHQQELTTLKQTKQGFLQKMFPKEGESVPEVRFPGFTGDWEDCKLESIYGKIRNAFVGTSTPYYVEDGHFYLESNNVKDGQINRNTEVFINDEFYQKQKDNWLHTGDLVMVQSGHVGHTAVIPEELDNTAAHALIMFSNYREKTDPYFINYQLQTQKSKKKLGYITTGNTIKHILASEMKIFLVDIPKYEEQQTIGNFFKLIDNTIALYQRELAALKETKKAFLQKMFV